METEPPKADPPKRKRRWFQFSLRSLMIGVTLLAVPLGYVGWQAKIVRDRKSWRDAIVRLGGSVSPQRPRPPGGAAAQPVPQPNWLRRLLGDEPAGFILLPQDWLYDPLNRQTKITFPEATIFQKAGL
jgi:hypothetical protein